MWQYFDVFLDGVEHHQCVEPFTSVWLVVLRSGVSDSSLKCWDPQTSAQPLITNYVKFLLYSEMPLSMKLLYGRH